MQPHQRGAAVQCAGLERLGLAVHADVAQDAAAHGGDGAQDDGRDDVEPRRQALAHADHGPQRYRQVVQQVDDGVEIGGQLTEVEHHHARDGAGDDQRRLLERVDTVVLQQDVAHDAAGQTGDNGDARHAEYIVACAHCAHGAGQTAGQRSGKLQPEGDGEGDVQHGALTLRRRAAAARRQRRPRPTPRAPQRVRPRSLARW